MELYKILQLRINVFVVEQNCAYDDCDGKDIDGYHLWCEMNNQIIAYCRILPPTISYAEPSIGRVISHENFRHQHFGTRLMKFAAQISENLFGISSIRISAQCYLKDFYEKLGYSIVSDEYLEDDIPHVEMLKN